MILTGEWPDGKKVASFLNATEIKAESPTFQVHQTWSKCSLEKFQVDKAIHKKDIEQYRAFCPEWELWVRNINTSVLRFRFISSVRADLNGFKDEGFMDVNLHDDLNNLKIETASYPLWGKLLKGYEQLSGWYTQEIPQLLKYPVDSNWNQVAVQVENFMRPDGTVDLVRYCSLVLFDEKTSKDGEA
jgi:hypothetical protein